MLLVAALALTSRPIGRRVFQVLLMVPLGVPTIALIGADASEDCIPSGYPNIAMPVHLVGLVAMGLSLNEAKGKATVGASIAEVMPEIAPLLTDAVEIFPRAVQSQVTIKRGVAERTFNIRVTAARRAEEGVPSFVVTLDDITELVSAQRTSAWADVARRIAHEIKNPLTPIQLSAERIRRKYGASINQDRDTFEKLTDTIVRQVGDIKKMVHPVTGGVYLYSGRFMTEDVAWAMMDWEEVGRDANP